MKRIWVSLLLILILGLVVALDEPSVLGGDAEKLQEDIDTYIPIDDGEIDFEGYKPLKSKAEERVEKINTYVGPITNFLFGVELTLSWIFVFALIMWILLIELIVVPVSSIFDWNIWASLGGSVMIATLAMQGFGKDFVIWIESLMTQWWIGFVVIVGAGIFAVIYSVFFKSVGVWAKESREKAAADRTKMDRRIISTHAKLSEKELESYSN